MALSDDRGKFAALKRLVQGPAHSLGLHIGRFPPVDSLGYHLQVLFRELRIDCVLDVGAHVGEYAQFLRDIKYRGEIISFEPVKASYEVLNVACTRSGDREWHVRNVALGREEGSATINVFRGSVFNSFLQP